jgi:hypothetical protein
VPAAPALTPCPRSTQVGEFEVAISGGVWVAAGELYLTSLANTLVELDPTIRDPFKENFLSVTDIQRRMIQSELLRENFDEAVKSLTSYFELMKGGGFFKNPE